MPALKVIAEKSLSPSEKAISAISAEFLKSLGEKFGFDGTNPPIIESVRNIAEGYFVVLGRRRPATRKETRREYIQLANSARKFRDILENAKTIGIDGDMEYAAAMETIAGKLSVLYDRGKDTAPHGRLSEYFELIRLVDLLVSAAEYGKENCSAKPGPKIDQPLEMLVRRAANFWIFELDRKFTIDQHKGSGTTKSFEFVRMLASRLDDSISDTEIVTAMRAEKEKRRKFDISRENYPRRAR